MDGPGRRHAGAAAAVRPAHQAAHPPVAQAAPDAWAVPGAGIGAAAGGCPLRGQRQAVRAAASREPGCHRGYRPHGPAAIVPSRGTSPRPPHLRQNARDQGKNPAVMPVPAQRRHRVNGCSHSDTRYATTLAAARPVTASQSMTWLRPCAAEACWLAAYASARQWSGATFTVTIGVTSLPYRGGLVTTQDHEAASRAQDSGNGHLSWPYPRHAGQRGHRWRALALSLRRRPSGQEAAAPRGGSGELAGQMPAARHRLPGTSWPRRPVPARPPPGRTVPGTAGSPGGGL